MNISDLNHLEALSDVKVVGGTYWSGGGSNIDVNIDKEVDIHVDEYVNVYKDFCVDSHVDGISAFAEAEALAYGYDAHAESLTFTYTKDDFATSSAQSISLTG
ncbi:hypothetical protein [Geitlerinema sp. PCC 7407]|uniref:hypothetical protein n=1 Tax=Geitlerinema sp. PCC 7407 TaxID=1173025 RepID=UPI00029FEEB9|nr:hypothetical protein [Geitlerinema sp. PCC 7407]AFY66901.1 hypothetical protein GEI7407_2426 [Geitlerinema sp. PCC 7407]